jgi:secreted PhoX family phosphatase
MRRFYHEAVAFDPSTGIAYMTEDNGPNAGFYRFSPERARPLAGRRPAA